VAVVVRLLCGLVFVGFGLMKLLAHDSEVRSFQGYGIPEPTLVVPALGALELGGGLLLLIGLWVRLVAVALAAVMVGAITTSGIQHGERVSLTLAPAMLAGMLFLLWSGRRRPVP
jgi:putative oxidoreductase